MSYQIAGRLAALLMVIWASRARNCTPILQSSPTIGQLETGSFSLSHGVGVSQRFYTYDVVLKNTPPVSGYSLAVSILYIEKYDDPNGLDFAVRPLKNTTFFKAFLIISKEAKWVSCHIHYIATSRDDFLVGYFIANENELLNFSSTNSLAKNIRISYCTGDTQWGANQAKKNAFAFLSGIKTENPLFNAKIIPGFVDYNKGTISLTLATSKTEKPIENLYISYIVYLINGRIQIDVIFNPESYLANTLGKSNPQSYSFTGMIAVNGSNLEKLKKINSNSRRLLAENEYDLSNLKIFVESFQIQALGITNNEVLEGTILRGTIQDDLYCPTVDTCLQDGGNIRYINQTNYCVKCEQNKQYSEDTGDCRCKDGFIEQPNGKCITSASFCGQNNVLINKTCFAKINQLCGINQVYNSTQSKCVCLNGYISMPTLSGDLSCVQNCPSEATISLKTLSCECPKGFEYKNKVCQPCDSLQEWNNELKKCVCISQVFTTSTGGCRSCNPNANFNRSTDTCQCKTGFVGNGIICRKVNQATLASPSGLLTSSTSILLSSSSESPVAPTPAQSKILSFNLPYQLPLPPLK